MEIPSRLDALHSTDTEKRAGTDTRNPAGNSGFGEMLAEIRYREVPRKEDRDTPPPGTEAAFVGQPAPLPVRPSNPATEKSPDEAGGKSAAAEAVSAAAADDGKAPSDAAAPQSRAPAASPERFTALLESSANDLATTALQTLPADTPAVAAPTPRLQPAAAPAVTATIAPPLQSPAWPAAFNNTMRILVSDQTQVARLQLTPGDLGPVDVRIAISEHRAEIAFAVSSPEAKAAIQQALPQLRETFAAGGLQLGDATFGESSRGSSDPASRGNGRPDDSRGSGETEVPLAKARAVGLIDLYA